MWHRLPAGGIADPIAALVDDLADWPAAERSSLVKLMRAKGRPAERDYARRLAAHTAWYRAIVRFCRNEQRRCE